jgi:hypothetical protein
VIILSAGAGDEHFMDMLTLPLIEKRTWQFQAFWLR